MKLWQALKQADFGTVGRETIKWDKSLLGPESGAPIIMLTDEDDFNWAEVDQFQVVELNGDRTIINFLDKSNASHDMELFSNKPVALEEPVDPFWNFKASAVVQIRAETKQEAAEQFNQWILKGERPSDMSVSGVQLLPLEQ